MKRVGLNPGSDDFGPASLFVNNYELATIRSLIWWQAERTKTSAQIIQDTVEQVFELDNISFLKGSAFNDVVDFLVNYKVVN